MTTTYKLVKDVAEGETIRFSPDDPVVTVLKVTADRMGFDMLYQYNGSEPRWRGFDDGDRVVKA